MVNQANLVVPNHVFLTGCISPLSNNWKIAADTKLLVNNNLQTADTRFFGSVHLQDEEEEESSNNNNVSPVQLSLQLDGQRSAVALTQRIAFDRIHFNLMDDRVPLVRNTIGWTLRMEQSLSANKDSSMLSSSSSLPRVTLGAVWQLNRATAIKAVWHNDNQSLTAALIGRRWKHPRVTCSVLGRYHVPTHSAAWLGLSLEVETGQFPQDAENGNGAPPPTQMQLPPGVKIDNESNTTRAGTI